MNITEALQQIEKNYPEAAKVIRAERDAIAKSICVTLDDGTAPDNLADHVEYLMLQEYYPAKEEIERLRRNVKALESNLRFYDGLVMGDGDHDKVMLAQSGAVLLESFRLLGLNEFDGQDIQDIPDAIQSLQAKLAALTQDQITGERE